MNIYELECHCHKMFLDKESGQVIDADKEPLDKLDGNRSAKKKKNDWIWNQIIVKIEPNVKTNISEGTKIRVP